MTALEKLTEQVMDAVILITQLQEKCESLQRENDFLKELVKTHIKVEQIEK